jgi:uncharacterized membrane protein YhaH (DUF805 family)
MRDRKHDGEQRLNVNALTCREMSALGSWHLRTSPASLWSKNGDMDAPSPPPISTWQYTTPDDEVRADQAWINFWRKAFTYNGRATRAEYNWALAQFLVILFFASLMSGLLPNEAVGTGFDAAVWLLFIVPWIALISRRCHDLNRRGTFGLWLLATGVGFLVTQGFLIFGKSDPRGARFDRPAAPVEFGAPEVEPHSDLSK